MSAKKKKTPTFFSILPATVRYDKSLNPYARLLYSELTALSEKEGYSWATNNYLANLYQVDRSSISHWIKQLQDKGYIRIELIYDKAHCYIEERRIYITNLVSEPQANCEENPPETDEMNNYAENCNVSGGGGDIYHQGGDVCNQGVVTNITRGGYKAPQRSLQAIITSSSSSDPPAEKPPPEEEESKNILSLKQFLKDLNPAFVFSESFYQKAVGFMVLKCLDSSYASWLYDFCVKKKPKSLENYFFKVFFDDRCAELYLEESKPLPVKVFKCPVCSTEHDSSLLACPRCRLDKSYRNDQKRILRGKRLYEMPENIKKSYNDELDNIIHSRFDFQERINQIESLELKYGLL